MTASSFLTRFRGKCARLRQRLLLWDLDGFLNRVPGVIHIGANVGQEREAYAARGLKVLWVEPIPQVFAQLCENIRKYPEQRAVQELVGEIDGEDRELFVSSNGGESSSMLPTEKHAELWPEIRFPNSVALQTITLPRLLAREQIDLADYPALILDIQGAELLVLKGAEDALPRFRYIKLEAADFESYRGCCTARELGEFLGRHGFRERKRVRTIFKKGVGSYYDLLFERVGSISN